MNIKLTNKQAIEVINAFTTLGDKVLPMKLAFAVGKNLEKIQATIYRPYTKTMEQLKAKHVVLDENGNRKTNEHGREILKNIPEYEEKLNELLDIENDFEAHTITEALLEQCDADDKYSKLTVKELSALMKFIEG